MKRKSICFFSAACTGVVLALFFLVPLSALSEEPSKTPKRVAVLPFRMNAERDLSYLREGIMDMLASRLHWPGKVAVIEKQVIKKAMAQHKGDLTPESALELGRKLKVDYVLYGSLTLFGESVSLDATMAGLAKKQEPLTVFVQTKGMESVIPEVNKFAQKVNAKIFGRPFVDPDYAYIPRSRYPGRSYIGSDSLNPAFTRYHQVKVPERMFWKSPGFKSEIRGMDIGDVDGDGKKELVVIEGIKLRIFRHEKGSLRKLFSHTALDKERFVSLDVADINGNGRAEIYASKMRGSTTVATEILEVGEKGGLKMLRKRSPWLLRVMNWHDKGEILVGQKVVGAVDTEYQPDLIDAFFQKGIFQLKWDGGRLVQEGKKPLLNFPSIFIFNFAIGDLGDDENPEIVFIDRYDKLRLLDHEGTEIYKSSDYFGGTLNYLVAAPNQAKTTEGSLKVAYIYVPARILIADLDENGRNEIIINQNTSAMAGLSDRFKLFSDGKIVSLTWTGISLDPNWESRKLSGCLADYQLDDLDNDGKLDLSVALIQKRKAKGISVPKSVVVSYKLKMKHDEAEETAEKEEKK